MTPFYLKSGRNLLFAVYENPENLLKDTAVLIVPPFGTQDLVSYRARKDWSEALAAQGFACLRIDLPGTGDSSGSPRNPDLLMSWSAAICDSVAWLRAVGHPRVAVIALGFGCLVTLDAIAGGTIIDELVLWGLPTSGTKLLRELKIVGRIDLAESGAPLNESADGELNVCGHVITADTVNELKKLDGVATIRAGQPARAMLIGRDGSRPEKAILAAFQAVGCQIAEHNGVGWRAMVEDIPGLSPTPVFQSVNRWLEQTAAPGRPIRLPSLVTSAELGPIGERIRERPVVFDCGTQQLFAVITEPLDRPRLEGTIVFFNAGTVRRIGPSRMWVEFARHWGARGVSVVRLDVEGVGDAGGDHTQYADRDNFYTPELIDQCRAGLELAIVNGLPDRFLLCGLCSGAFSALHVGLADCRAKGIFTFNLRTTNFGPQNKFLQDLYRLASPWKRHRLRRLLRAKYKLHRVRRLTSYLIRSPQDLVQAPERSKTGSLSRIFKTLEVQDQRLDMAFAEKEPMSREIAAEMKSMNLRTPHLAKHRLPYASHTLTPFESQRGAHELFDQMVQQTFDLSQSALLAPSPCTSPHNRRKLRRKSGVRVPADEPISDCRVGVVPLG